MPKFKKFANLCQSYGVMLKSFQSNEVVMSYAKIMPKLLSCAKLYKSYKIMLIHAKLCQSNEVFMDYAKIMKF
jgi:hypothetical protein